MKPVFLASPLSAPDAQTRRRHRNYARRAMLHSLSLGEAPFAPHLLYTQILDDDDPDGRDLGISAGTAWLGRAEALIVYADLGISKGMAAEMSVAVALKLPTEIRYIGAPALRSAPEPAEKEVDEIVPEGEENT